MNFLPARLELGGRKSSLFVGCDAPSCSAPRRASPVAAARVLVRRSQDMKRLTVAAVLLFEVGCASAIRDMMGQRRDETAPLTKIRADADGVCAYLDASKGFNGSDQVMACARHDAAGDRAVLFTEILCRTEDPRFDPATWNLVVTRQDGAIVLEQRKLQLGSPYRVGCVYGVCVGRRASVDPVNTAWAPGRYAIHYENAADATAYDLSITLQ